MRQVLQAMMLLGLVALLTACGDATEHTRTQSAAKPIEQKPETMLTAQPAV